MLFRAVIAAFLFSAAAFAVDHRPVCPGPAAPGTSRCHARVVTDSHGNPLATLGPFGYRPGQFRIAYGLPSAASKVQTIAIVDAYNDPNVQSDLAVYSKQFALPPCTTANGCFKKVNQTGGSAYPPTNAGWALEISLDVEIVHGLCPNCKYCWSKLRPTPSPISSKPLIMPEPTQTSFRIPGAAASSRAKRRPPTTLTLAMSVYRLHFHPATMAMAHNTRPRRSM